MSLYRLDASIRVEGSHSRAIADIVAEWRSARGVAHGRAAAGRFHGRELGAAVAITPPRPPRPAACARRTTSDPGFVTSDQWKSAPRRATLG